EASLAALCAAAAAVFARDADWAAESAFWSTSVMRVSFRLVRSCVSSNDLPIESTLSFTSPTLVRTNFLLAQAVDPPTARSAMGIATKNLRIVESSSSVLLMVRNRVRARLPREVPATSANDEIPMPSADDERMPARLVARFERDQVLMSQLVDDLPRRDAALCRRTDDKHVTASPRRQVRQCSGQRRSFRCGGRDVLRGIVD